jgi:hypothetical protein
MLTLVVVLCIGLMGMAVRLQAVQRALLQLKHEIKIGMLVPNRGYIMEEGRPDTLREIKAVADKYNVKPLKPFETMTVEEFNSLDLALAGVMPPGREIELSEEDQKFIDAFKQGIAMPPSSEPLKFDFKPLDFAVDIPSPPNIRHIDNSDYTILPGITPMIMCKHGVFKYGQCADCLAEEGR